VVYNGKNATFTTDLESVYFALQCLQPLPALLLPTSCHFAHIIGCFRHVKRKTYFFKNSCKIKESGRLFLTPYVVVFQKFASYIYGWYLNKSVVVLSIPRCFEIPICFENDSC